MSGRLGVNLAVVALALVPLGTTSAQVRFERTGYRLTSIGERMAVSARVVDGRRQPVANANIRWRVADPSIASVTPQGIVVSRKVGYTRLWAVAGQDSASALILVDQWAAKFDFMPALVRLHAVGAKAPLRILVRDAAGHPIASQSRRSSACRSVDGRIATLAPNGEVTARGNGATYVRCTDRGIADSVRIEVRQLPVRAQIADKLSFGNKVVGDTFRIRLNATDAAGDEIQNVQATWASLNPTMVNVDPLTGWVRAVGAGTARIVAQAGDATDTVTVGVAAGAGLAVPAAADSAPTLGTPETARVPTLNIESVYPFEGDTTHIRVTARDAAGIEVPNPEITLRSSDPEVLIVLPGQRVLPRKAGSAFLIGRFGTSTIDSAQITVRTRSSTRVSAVEETRSTFRRPSFDTATARVRYDAATKRVRDSIFDFSPVGRKGSGRLIAVSLVAGQAAHSFSDSTGREQRSGLLYGGTAELAPHRWIKLSVDFRTGTLSASDAIGGNDLAVTEAGADLTFQPTDWFGLRAGYIRRATREGLAGEPVAVQQWNFPRVSAMTRFSFVGGAVATVTGISILPGASYTGYVDQLGNAVKPDPFSLAGEAGLELHTGWLRAGMTYYIEKFTFPKVGTSTRVDQFSTIRLRLGLQLGR